MCSRWRPGRSWTTRFRGSISLPRGGSIDWNKDGTGFYYTRYPRGNERPPEDANFYQQVYFHKLGTKSSDDTYVIGKDFPRIAEIQLRTSDDGQWLLATVANGDGGEFAHYLVNSAGQWIQVTHFEDAIVSAKFGADGDAALYLLSRKDAPRGKVLRLPLADPSLAKAQVIVPQSSGSGCERRWPRLDRQHHSHRHPTLCSRDDWWPFASAHLRSPGTRFWQSCRATDLQPCARLFKSRVTTSCTRSSTYLEPTAWYRYEATTGKSGAHGDVVDFLGQV